MYVPALGRKSSHEVGHPNYQHPRRGSAHFGPYLDNFAAWVIYLSLFALSIDPALWHTTEAGDECLLFRQGDFANPHTSRAFAALEGHPYVSIRILALTLRNLLQLEPDRIPELDLQSTSTQIGNGGDGSAAWIQDYVSPLPNSTQPIAKKKSGRWFYILGTMLTVGWLTSRVAEIIKQPTATPTPIATPTPTATPTLETVPTYRVVGVQRGDFLNMRQGPGQNFPIVQWLENGVNGIKLKGNAVNNGGTMWQRIESRGVQGWVATAYLAPDTMTTPVRGKP